MLLVAIVTGNASCFLGDMAKCEVILKKGLFKQNLNVVTALAGNII